MNDQQIDRLFTYHNPTAGQIQRYAALRAKAKEMAQLIQETCPESREKALAITNLQQSTQWANASIAINDGVAPQGDRPETESRQTVGSGQMAGGGRSSA